MTLYVWPYRLLPPASYSRPRLTGRVAAGPPALTGVTEVNAADGGGHWTYSVSGVFLADWRQVNCWEAWTAHLDGGARPFVMPIPSLGLAPRPQVGGRPALPGSPPPSSDFFAQDPSFGRPMMRAALTADVAAGATALSFEITRGAPLQGGEQLTIHHATEGWRTYTVSRVTSRAGMIFGVEVRPPLRDLAANGDVVELDVPRCMMALDPANPGDMGPGSEVGLYSSVSARFVEWFGPFS